MRTVLTLLKRKRIWIFNFILPFLFGYFFLNFLGDRISSYLNGTGTPPVIAWIGGTQIDWLEELKKRKDLEIRTDLNVADLKNAINNGEVDVAWVWPENSSLKLKNKASISLDFYHNGNERNIQTASDLLREFETGIIKSRLDSINISQTYIDPIRIEEKNTTDSMAITDNYIRNSIPPILLLFSFLGLIFPCSISLYRTFRVKKKNEVKLIPLWDGLLGVSFFGITTVAVLVAAFWLSISTFENHPSFLKGIIKNYLSIGNVLQIMGLLFLSNILWSCVLAFLDRKTERRLGRFGIYFFGLFAFIFSLAIVTAIIIMNNPNGNFFTAGIPLLNNFIGIRNILTPEGISFPFILFLVAGLLFGNILAFFSLKFSKSNQENP